MTTGGNEGRKIEKARGDGRTKKAASSGCDKTDALKNSQQLWLPAHDLHETKPVTISAWNGEGHIRTPSLAEELLAADASGGRKVSFL